MDDLYTEDNNPDPKSKGYLEFNLMLLKELSKEGERLTYTGTSINDWSPMGRSDCNRRRFTV
jgi:hypothetical protein